MVKFECSKVPLRLKNLPQIPETFTPDNDISQTTRTNFTSTGTRCNGPIINSHCNCGLCNEFGCREDISTNHYTRNTRNTRNNCDSHEKKPCYRNQRCHKKKIYFPYCNLIKCQKVEKNCQKPPPVFRELVSNPKSPPSTINFPNDKYIIC